jgi:hypothetical protein
VKADALITMKKPLADVSKLDLGRAEFLRLVWVNRHQPFARQKWSNLPGNHAEIRRRDLNPPVGTHESKEWLLP